MTKDELSTLLRDYVKNHLSPTKEEHGFISGLYSAFQTALGNSTLMIGSYARYTAIRPLHDLDILYLAGSFDPNSLNPQKILTALQQQLQTHFKNPTKLAYKISQQTHSITVTFSDNGEEKFSVDVVPAFTSGQKNEFGDDTYWVPEIVKTGPRNRRAKYETLEKSKHSEIEWWLKTDPRGYIKAATSMNGVNDDFRKTAKLVKRWKHNCKEKFGEFKLKSFHIEQCTYAIYQRNPHLDISDVVFEFFYTLPTIIAKPQIPDRADSTKYIDDYLGALTFTEREKIIRARDAFLIKLEEIAHSVSIENLLEADERRRRSDTESYLFDQGIPTYIERGLSLGITGKVLERNGGFRAYILDAIGKIVVDRRIEFRISSDSIDADMFKWKVKNDDNSSQPRGEITDHRTLHDPEHTQFRGNHYVECYAIQNGVCVARTRQNVVLK